MVLDGEKMPCALIQPDFAYVKNWAELHNVKIIDSPKEIAANPAVKIKNRERN
jgi:long-chain acyl-CoA synthetase